MESNVTNANVPQAPDNSTMKHKLQEYIKLAKIGSKTLAQDVVDWILEKPEGVNHGAHPQWPGYTGTGTSLDFKLKPKAYDSRTLVENTVFCFFPTPGNANLKPVQLQARKKIKKLYQKIKDQNDAVTPQNINTFMHLFDDFFFFGAMLHNGRPRIHSWLWEKEDRHLQRFASIFTEVGRPLGFMRSQHIRGYGPVSEIHIAGRSFFPSNRPLRFYLATLIHEMAHAYLSLYVCNCVDCECDKLNTTGLTGHGPSFIMLMDAINFTMHEWDIGLHGLAVFRNIMGYAGEPDEIKLLRGAEADLAEAFLQVYLQRMQSAPQLLQPAPSSQGEDGNPHNYNLCLQGNEEGPGMNNWKPTRAGERQLKTIRKRKHPRKFVSERGSICLCVHGMKALNIREPGMNVYMTAVQVGATVVNAEKLDETAATVQTLLRYPPKRRFPWSKGPSNPTQDFNGEY
ncbi:hypothetical protein F5Y10DRAFT_80342 [Nemania abortiva]|nr:hypothetical protein F5Y10DRAFT_80342 [Nemania abortiva]